MVRIFVEGQDDKKFIIKFLYHLREQGVINIEKSYDPGSYIQTMNGKRKLLDSSRYARFSKEIDSGKIKKVLFIFDCDFEEDDKICNGIDKSIKCFEKLKKDLNWSIPIDYYIFDKNLDFFLLTTIDKSRCYDEFKKLEECLGVEKIKKNKKPIANLYRDLYPGKEFDFSHNSFDELKKKLIKLFKEA